MRQDWEEALIKFETHKRNHEHYLKALFPKEIRQKEQG